MSWHKLLENKGVYKLSLVACLVVAAFLLGSLTKSTRILGGVRGEADDVEEAVDGQHKHRVDKRSVKIDHVHVRAPERPVTDPRTRTPKPDGAVYIRWGKRTCPSEASIIYKGAMAGGHSTHTGGGGEYICLSDTPVQEKFVAGGNSYSYIYGAEYKAHPSLFSPKYMHGFTNHDGNCVACLSIRNSKVMIPGTNLCPKTWTKEYHGVLMSSKYTDKGNKNYICVDYESEADREGYRADGGADMWPVEVSCGSLPCPPYEHIKELTCVVCTH